MNRNSNSSPQISKNLLIGLNFRRPACKQTVFTRKGETGLNFIDVLSGLTRDRWYRGELIRALRSGPGAASLYFSAFCGSLCLMLSSAFMKEMETASMAVFLVMLIVSSSFIIFDLWFYL